MPASTPRMQLMHPDITRTCSEREVYESLLKLDGAQVLDLGCGKADHARNIAAAHPGVSVIAAEVDRIQHAANLASARPANLTFADFGAESIPLADAGIDVVMMFRSLHHVPGRHLDEALAEIRRVLRPGGHVYISEPIFAGALSEMIRIYNDEQAVRLAAFAAVCRSVENGLFELAGQTFFRIPVHYKDFAEFSRKHFEVTHSERNLSAAQRNAVERLFDTHLGPNGVDLTQPIRIDLLRKPR